jgi:hypothetical protein
VAIIGVVPSPTTSRSRRDDMKFHTTAVRVESYLVGFVERYIPDDVFRFNTKVLNVAAEEGLDAESP